MAYTDLSGSYFIYKSLVLWTWFDALAENDAYDRIPVGTVKTFFQAAAPTGWTQVTTQNDKALRVTSGAGGGSGGAVGIATAFSLAHTHTVNAHTHTNPNHQHQLDYASTTANVVTTGVYTGSADGTGHMYQSSGANPGHFRVYSATETSGSAFSTATANPATDSQLSNATLAYIDLILASKD